MMEEVGRRPSMEYIAPPLPPKAKLGATTFTQIPSEEMYDRGLERGSMHPLVLNSKSTVFLAANECADAAPADTGRHVVTIRINTETEKAKPKISSVHLKSEAEFDPFKLEKKNSSLVRLNVDDNLPKIVEHDELGRTDEKPPYIYCNAYPLNSITNMVMSSGQCSPSDTLDSGTCSDLDSTPPPQLPKKKTSKSASKKVSVTLISPTNGVDETDFADNESNISCDSLNSSELNGDSQSEASKEEKKKDEKTVEGDDSFLPRGLLQDIRDRCPAKTESEEASPNVNGNANLSKESAELTSFRLVTKFNNAESGLSNSKTLINESTYEERKRSDKLKAKTVLGTSYDTDKFYDFHLNEKQFEDSAKSVVVKSDNEVEFFAGIKDFKSEEPPSTIRSSKGTIRGVKNRVRAGIATFLQIQSTTKSYKEKDAGKIVIYTTTMGIVRSTYQRCVLVKKILRNLLVKYEERDVFMSVEYQDEIRERMKSEQILVPQLFVDGQHVGDADTVEKLNESGELRKMLKPYKSPDACNTCQMCGGFRLLPCRICNGSKKSLHRNHFTAEFVALKCMNCDEVGLVKCEACC